MENNMRHFLFGPNNNLSNKVERPLSTPAKHPLNDEIRNRFNQILTNDIFQKILPYLHYSRGELFKRILPQLQTLSTKIKLSNIDLLDLAFIINESALIEFILELKKLFLTRDTLDKAVLCDNINALILLEKKGFAADIRLMRFAAEYGCLESLKYCVARGITPEKSALDDAALNGHLHVIKYLVNERNISPDSATLDWAIIGACSTPNKLNEATIFLTKIVFPEPNNQNNRAMNYG